MKLYELIELGSTHVVEEHNCYLGERKIPIASLMGETVLFRQETCGCALGTAAFAAGMKEADFFVMTVHRTIIDHVPHAKEPVTCPECMKTGQLLVIAEHLHLSGHNWPRQRIAEWLKPIEDSLEQKRQEEEAATKPVAMETQNAANK